MEIVRRVSRGKVKRVDVARGSGGGGRYVSRSVGTQTEGLGVGDGLVGRGSRRKSAVLAREGWEMLHTADVGLLFMASPGVGEGGDGQEEGKDVLPLTGNLLRKLQQAIAADAALQACQKRTAREIATLNTHQENLRKRKEVLKERLELLKDQRVSDFDEEKVTVDKELVRVWEASIETMDERLRCDERLERSREAFERVARAALAVLALGLAERMLVDVVEEDGKGRRGSEMEVGKRWRLSCGY